MTRTKQTVSYLETRTPYAVEFTIMDQDEILKSSVVEIKNERIYEQGWLFPTLEGVNDPRMGAVDRDTVCLTCKGN
jgi:DNA-directed RNA polymerase beta' subunit